MKKAWIYGGVVALLALALAGKLWHDASERAEEKRDEAAVKETAEIARRTAAINADVRARAEAVNRVGADQKERMEEQTQSEAEWKRQSKETDKMIAEERQREQREWAAFQASQKAKRE